MKSPRFKALALIFLASSSTLTAALPFLFWLPGPHRDNPNDPKSASFVPLSTPGPSTVPSPTPIPTPSYLWCDFETDISSGFWAPAGPTLMTQSWSSDTAVSGTHSWKMDMGAGTGYGHWTGLDISPPVNLAGATTMRIWAKSDQPLMTELHWAEGTTNGADGETWWRNMSIPGDNTWHEYVFLLSSFFVTASGGNGIRDTQSIQTVWFYNLVPYNAQTLYIDDIRFTP